jgi:hypothetical protein
MRRRGMFSLVILIGGAHIAKLAVAQYISAVERDTAIAILQATHSEQNRFIELRGDEFAIKLRRGEIIAWFIPTRLELPRPGERVDKRGLWHVISLPFAFKKGLLFADRYDMRVTGLFVAAR